jgi:hypothetical protein
MITSSWPRYFAICRHFFAAIIEPFEMQSVDRVSRPHLTRIAQVDGVSPADLLSLPSSSPAVIATVAHHLDS